MGNDEDEPQAPSRKSVPDEYFYSLTVPPHIAKIPINTPSFTEQVLLR